MTRTTVLLPILVPLMLALAFGDPRPARADVPTTPYAVDGIGKAMPKTEAEWSALATTMATSRLDEQWKAMLDADKTLAAWSVRVGGETFTGEWVVRIGAWTHFIAYATTRCRIQEATYITCGKQDFVPLRDAVVDARASERRQVWTVSRLRELERAVFGTTVVESIDNRGVGHSVLEVTVSGPNAERRTSRRYRVPATLTTTGYTLEAPALAETYDEQCYAISGCYTAHWTCTRVTSSDRVGRASK